MNSPAERQPLVFVGYIPYVCVTQEKELGSKKCGCDSNMQRCNSLGPAAADSLGPAAAVSLGPAAAASSTETQSLGPNSTEFKPQPCNLSPKSPCKKSVITQKHLKFAKCGKIHPCTQTKLYIHKKLKSKYSKTGLPTTGERNVIIS